MKIRTCALYLFSRGMRVQRKSSDREKKTQKFKMFSSSEHLEHLTRGVYVSNVMLRAVLIGAVSAAPLVLGAWIALKRHPSNRVVGLISAFGAGALISAVAFELVLDAAGKKRPAALAAALALGAIVYFLGSTYLERRNKTGSASARGLALLMGATLDGIPESLILGISIAARVGLSLPFLVAVFVSNLPEGMASAGKTPTTQPGASSACGSSSYAFRL
jgi:zinc transporter ZupT